MSTFCKYCPPLDFQAHTLCHIESIKFRVNTKKLRNIRHHIIEEDFILICQKKKQLDDLFKLSYSEADFVKLAATVKRFNRLIEIFLIILNNRISIYSHGAIERRLG